MRAIAVLEVMWDWEARTSSAGYEERAPPYFRINGENFTGKRLYWFLGHFDLLVTNACPQLVSSARGRGIPDRDWLHDNLTELTAMPGTELVLVCGAIARKTYAQKSIPKPIRIVEMPHPAARMWTRAGLEYARRIIQEGTTDVELDFEGGRLVARKMIPF